MIYFLHRWKDHHQNPLQEEKWKQQHPNYTQSGSLHKLNRPEQVILFRLRTGHNRLTPTCTSLRLASLRCAHAAPTSWLQNIYCSTVHYMMLWGMTCGLNRRYWGTSCMATWRSWGGQLPSWEQQASPSSVWRRRRSRNNLREEPETKLKPSMLQIQEGQGWTRRGCSSYQGDRQSALCTHFWLYEM